MKGRSLSGWVLGFLFVVSAAAQSGPDNDPSAAQGYVQNAFHHSSFDSINQYNGQLTVPVALGPAYTVGPNLRFQLALTYNSRVTEPGNPTDETSPNYYPVVGDPAIGVGWTLTAGKIGCGALPTSAALNRPCYIRPDGAQIDFGAPNSRTSDATPYELVHNGVSPNDSYTLYDGDGNRYDFAWRVAGYDDNAREAPQQGPGYARDYGRGRDGYYLTSLQDPFGNRVTVIYASGVAAPCPSACTALPIPVGSMRCSGTTALSWIPASVRIQRNGEAAATEIAQISTDPSTGRVQAIRLRTFAAGVAQFSEWTLSYDTVRLANRVSNLYCPTTLPTLAGIGLPADLGGAPRYAFTYYGEGDVGPGLLRTMTVPTGATIYYDYGNYHFYHGRRALFSDGDPCHDVPSDPPPSQGVRRSAILTASGGPGHRPEQDSGAPDRYLPTQGPCLPHVDSRQYEQHLLGVVQKAVRGPGMPDAVTSYVQYSFPFGETGSTGAQTLTVALLPPDVDGIRRAETTLFWAARTIIDPGDPPLPGDRLGADIRSAVFESDPNPAPGTPLTTPVCGAPSEMDRLCATHAIRVTRNLYQYGPDGASLPDPDDDGNLRRLRQTTTSYGHVATADPFAADLCPACLKHTVTWSLVGSHTWEGNGRHYDTESHDGNLGGDRRIVTTAWTPQDGPRLWNLYASRLVTDPDIPAPTSVTGVRNTIDQSFFFDPATGFLDASLTWDARTSLYAGDCRYEDASGNVADEVTANVLRVAGKPAANPCFSSVAAWAPGVIGLNGDAFGRRSLYSGGLLSSKQWLKDRTLLPWYESRVDRDPVTGWTRTSYSPASLSTAFTYDSLGRVVRAAPPAEAPTAVTYLDPRTTTVARSGADDASWQEFLYDGLGRLVREIRQMPSGYALRTHAFDPAGHPTFDSEWKSCVSAAGDCATGSATLGTRSLNFDPFGRAQSVTKADGAATTVSFTDGATPYSDTRKAVTTANVGCVWNGASCGGGVSSTSAYRFDAMGRVVTALEPGGDITTYTYDVAGKLVSVTQGGQVRTFAYDALGYLLRETTPEAGTVDYTATSGGSTYANRGSLGSPRTRADGFGTSGAVTRSYQYDAAGRPSCEIAGSFGAGQACDTPGLSLYVRSFYDGDGFAGGAYAAGRLTQRVGYNPIFSPPTTVTDQFTYSDPSGRLSRQNTSIVAGAASATAAQTWTYDALGLVKTHGQPRASGTFALTFGRSFGLVTSLTAPGQPVVRSASYTPSGALAAWTAGNGVVTTITPDVSLIPRASRIQTSGAVATSAGGNFDSGLYRYDGADNVVAMGSDTFGYDARSRLTSANFGSLGSQAFTYDRFGNLTAKGGSTYPVSAATNRLSTAAYDTRGNLTANGSETLTYDLLNRHIRFQSPGVDWKYAFDGAGERVAKTPVSGATTYTFRDEAGRISSEYVGTALGRDNMYIGNLLVASYVSSSLSGALGWQFYASDHLGSPRLVTDLSGQVVEARKYWPYGIGVSTNPATQQRVRFSAMERDSESNRYYDHARSHDFELGRFVSPDRVGGRATAPQSWNRYAYVLGNPMKHVDPDGQLTVVVHGTFAGSSPTFLPGGHFFERVASSTHDRTAASLQWSGSDSHVARLSAARALASFINHYTFAPGEKLSIVAHSHGGNVAIAAINLGLIHKVDNLVTLGTPSRDGYRLKDPTQVGNFVAVYNPYDQVQTHGGGDYVSPMESGPAARTHPFALNLVWNIDEGGIGSHAALHGDEAWNFVVPHLDLYDEGEGSYSLQRTAVHD